MSTYDPFVSSDAVVSVPVTTVWASPEAARDIDSPITQSNSRVERWMSSLDLPLRLDLLGRVHTQALMGEAVHVLNEQDGWSEVRLPWQPTAQDKSGYPGWIPSAHLLPTSATADPLCVLQGRLLFDAVLHEPLSIGTILTMPDQGSVRLTTGNVVRVSDRMAQQIRPLKQLLAHQVETDAVRALAQQFLGLSYLWGGMSGWGADCSGLVHVSARASGVMISRDSTDQFNEAKANTLALDADLLRWYAHPAGHERAGQVRHVAFALPGNRILHAPRSGFSVEVISAGEEPYRSDVVTHRSD
jgi:gamma-D-glutamyl-L-lysine dipeptidyl-peptidase